MATPRDNGDLVRKVAIRLRVLGWLSRAGVAPVVLETHGGWGVLWSRCYREACGTVLEQRADKAAVLARQRPTWAVYQADVTRALTAGVAGHQVTTLLDCDPYGDPWPTLEAFFGSARPEASALGVVVTDGMGLKAKRGGLWRVASQRPVVERYGDRPLARRVEIARERLADVAASAGYTLAEFGGWTCGHAGQMAHYAALLTHRGGTT